MSATLKIKVIPGATRESVEPFADGFKVKVRAAPEKGKANKAVLKLLATKLGIAPSSLSVVSGHTSALKTIAIDSLDADEIISRLEQD